jgi:hypothetical protein
MEQRRDLQIITIYKFITKNPMLISQGKENIINKVKDKIDYQKKIQIKRLKCCKSKVENIEVTLKVKFFQNNKVSSNYLIKDI